MSMKAREGLPSVIRLLTDAIGLVKRTTDYEYGSFLVRMSH